MRRLTGSLAGYMSSRVLPAILVAALLASLPYLSYAALQASPLPGSPNPLVNFPGDYYKLDGSPDLVVALERTTAYQNENASLFLTLKNRGIVNSIRVNQEPAANLPDEVFAAKMELDLEQAKTAAQEISVSLSIPYPSNDSPLEIRREVAYAGTLKAGQVSPPLAFPIEVYRNTAPDDYIIYATVNYTYQQDVAVKSDSGRPQNPDIYYLYESASQVVPLKLHVERRSGADLKVVGTSPLAIQVGSKNNIVRVIIKNVGHDTARDLVARLRPESGVYVDMDESPIPILIPGEIAELVYKVDVSKDAVGGKPYRFTLLFDYSDSFRKNLQDSDNVYMQIEPSLTARYWWVAAIAAAVAALVAIYVIRRKRTR